MSYSDTDRFLWRTSHLAVAEREPDDEGEKEAHELAEDDDVPVSLPDPDDNEAWEQIEKESNERIDKSGRRFSNWFQFARLYNYDKKITEHIVEYRDLMGRLAERLRAGEIDFAKWSYDSRVAIVRYTMDGHRLGIAKATGVAPSQVKMTTGQRKVAIGVIEEQHKYFAKFAGEVRDQLKQGQELTTGLDSRARMYGGSVRSASAGAALAEKPEQRLRWVRFAGDSCETCIRHGGEVRTGKEWKELDVWPAHNVVCLSNCRCTFSAAE